METESVRMLRQRASDINAEVAGLRAEIAPLEFELRQVEAAIALMTNVPANGLDASRNAVAHGARQANPEFQSMSMKQLVVQALTKHFPNGATAIEMLEFFALRWGRSEILRTSLSPQLSRLKDEGKIELRGKVWHIAEAPQITPAAAVLLE